MRRLWFRKVNCPTCGRLCALRIDGKIWSHKRFIHGAGRVECSGNGVSTPQSTKQHSRRATMSNYVYLRSESDFYDPEGKMAG